MRRTLLIKAIGPYQVLFCANGELRVVPTWGQRDLSDDYAGPGMFARQRLAEEIERLLNGGKTYAEAKE
jgi:hypothetical protein